MLKHPIPAIQEALAAAGLDGWLLYEFHGRNPIAAEIVGAAGGLATRRWFYFIPADGEPRRICHGIELGQLADVHGERHVYRSWQSLGDALERVLSGVNKVAMEYSPNAAVPYVSLVDAGTIELVQSYGVEVVSSADLVSQFQARWNPEQLASHHEASQALHEIADCAFGRVRDALTDGETVREQDVHEFALAEFERRDLTTDAGPICGVGPNSGDPHHESSDQAIEHDQVLLLDLWARRGSDDAVYADITRMAYTGATVPDEVARRFAIVRDARDRAVTFINERLAAGRTVYGWEVDDAVRGVIADAGFAEAFVHRTGHSIGTDVHGTGPNIDNLETRDERRLIPGICFSIEPGIYLPDYGIRSEIDVVMEADRAIVTTQPVQEAMPALLA